ncbi:MAG: hypothetical protein M1358_25120 [Chloroflexi bacterium]|nr:hypothetical protein [Chloroflexota bacterium]
MGRRQREAASEEGVRRIGHLYLKGLFFQWVLDRGIEMIGRNCRGYPVLCSEE